MNGRATTHPMPDLRRMRLMGLLALLLAAAQLLYAAHAASSPDDLADHSPSSCEFCLAGALSNDPGSLVVDIAAPRFSVSSVRQPVAAEIIVAGALRAANPRGPPLH